eukprot:CAMPEP_0117084810 /NCGR_PEP_ID=MMETSP0472-20121206/59682_1 /TAXON_ID=693140 ORGANISM="Tiarina fusus, Strain LIS" /NCGR_SAMPLE_ID=MMETSP0472 /ASSEMBLY_ACC=CAM_ASM_000603 /LENGTH=167 /DNA_ID=CAMNT_0004813935 /DNA_START=18 /DNA_END=521 /DNA_ORIENTATION=+
MEGLRHSLLVPAGSTVLMVMGCFHAMKEQISARYAVKDDKNESLLPHPYAPWASVPKEYQSKADDAYRAFKMFENVKEWTLLGIPLMWTSFLYVGGLPYMTDNYVDGLIAVTSAAYIFGNAKFISGYMKSPETRLQGFKIRRKAMESWLLISVVSIGYAVLKRVGVV